MVERAQVLVRAAAAEHQGAAELAAGTIIRECMEQEATGRALPAFATDCALRIVIHNFLPFHISQENLTSIAALLTSHSTLSPTLSLPLRQHLEPLFPAGRGPKDLDITFHAIRVLRNDILRSIVDLHRLTDEGSDARRASEASLPQRSEDSVTRNAIGLAKAVLRNFNSLVNSPERSLLGVLQWFRPEFVGGANRDERDAERGRIIGSDGEEGYLKSFEMEITPWVVRARSIILGETIKRGEVTPPPRGERSGSVVGDGWIIKAK
ncbi:hypothetical protein BDZ97DRAFT_1836860 [Flammula alnicola]|nr:hypothetical protein BDZ97DRAFT_1836860 [Flammula alnicola]